MLLNGLNCMNKVAAYKEKRSLRLLPSIAHTTNSRSWIWWRKNRYEIRLEHTGHMTAGKSSCDFQKRLCSVILSYVKFRKVNHVIVRTSLIGRPSDKSKKGCMKYIRVIKNAKPFMYNHLCKYQETLCTFTVW